MDAQHCPAKPVRVGQQKQHVHCCVSHIRETYHAQANEPISEQHPLMLKDKAERMLAAGNHQGALQAFDSALAMDSSLVSALAGRAACHLHLHQARQVPTLCRM